MNKKTIKMRRLLLAAMAGVLGVNYGCDSYEFQAEYGCPSADFDISGQVTDKNGNPVEGIEVNPRRYNLLDTTDADGYYHLPKHNAFPDQQISIAFRDVDSNEHGAYRDTTVVVPVEHNEYRGGDGHWYEGTLTKEVNVTLEPKNEK